jgi:type VI secretion system secreted protein Hcp
LVRTAIVAGGAAAVAAAAVAVAQIPADNGTITGCYAAPQPQGFEGSSSVTTSFTGPSNGGQLRVVYDSSNCDSTETAITWNQRGPQGPQGPAGMNGANGANGANGTSFTAPTTGAGAGKGNTQVRGLFLVIQSPTGEIGLPKGQSLNANKFDPNSALELSAADFGASQTISIGSQGSGAGAGKVSFGDLTVRKFIDRASPQLFLDLAAGKHYTAVTLLVRRAGNVPYVQYTFKTVFVKSVNESFDGTDGSEEVHFAYGSEQVAYRQQAPDGSLGKPITTGWDRVTNTKLTAAP